MSVAPDIHAMIHQTTPFRPPAPPPKPRHALERHPQRQYVIDAALAGETCRQIAAKLNPPVSYAGVARFLSGVIRPAIQKAEAIKQAAEAAIAKTAPFPVAQQADSAATVNATSVQVIPPIRDRSRNSLSESVTRAILDADPLTSGSSAKMAIASHEGRVLELADRHRRLKQVIEERGKEMDGEAPGAGSGLLAKDYKGKNADQPVYKVDTGLLAECREHEKQAAQELGQWDAGAAPSVAIQIVIPATGGAESRADCIEIDAIGGRR